MGASIQTKFALHREPTCRFHEQTINHSLCAPGLRVVRCGLQRAADVSCKGRQKLEIGASKGGGVTFHALNGTFNSAISIATV